MFEYEIGGKTYVQRPLVLGQVRQIIEILKGVVIPTEVDAVTLIAALGEKLPDFLAVVLTEKGKNIRDKDIHALSRGIEFDISPEMAIKVVEDFFDCNPIASLLDRLTGILHKVTKSGKVEETGSKNSSVSSQEEISPKEIRSSGDTPSGNVSPT